MDIISAVRALCRAEDGFVKLFDKTYSHRILCGLVDCSRDVKRFETLIHGAARKPLLNMICNVYDYPNAEKKILDALQSDGLNESEAKSALEIFYRAFGFPGYRTLNPDKVSTLIEDGTFRVEYTGEVEDGKEHGIGVRECYYKGKWCNRDECVWMDGVMNGYNHAKELEFETFEIEKIGFVVNDQYVGTIRCRYNDKEENDHGVRLNIK